MCLTPPVADREGRSTALKAHTGTVRCVNFSADGKLLITAGDDKTVKVGQHHGATSTPSASSLLLEGLVGQLCLCFVLFFALAIAASMIWLASCSLHMPHCSESFMRSMKCCVPCWQMPTPPPHVCTLVAPFCAQYSCNCHHNSL